LFLPACCGTRNLLPVPIVTGFSNRLQQTSNSNTRINGVYENELSML
jgi:hypothetical protein